MTDKIFTTGTKAVLVILMLTFGVSAWAAPEKVLHSFGKSGTNDGIHPSCVMLDGAGNIYGVTDLGGAHRGGVAFELSPKTGGGWTYKILYQFNAKAFNSLACLVLDPAGNLYG